VKQLDLRETDGQAWVELPVVGRGAVLFRSFVDKGMRLGITSPQMWARTITIYSSWSAFNLALGILSCGEIYLALVDPDGTVHALIEGDVTEGKVKQLCAAFTPDFIINRLQRIMVLIRHGCSRSAQGYTLCGCN
tara:strand:+ start:945 stop:1349 length:405 start_codon:yes stop_codon:yes gene_type:complete